MIQSSMFMGDLMALLIQAENVSGRIFEARGYFGSIAANFLHDYAPFRSHFIDRCGRAVDHDVNQQTDFSHGFSMQDPGAAYFSDAVVESNAAVAAGANVPAENALVEFCRCLHVNCRHLDVADLAVPDGWFFVTAH